MTCESCVKNGWNLQIFVFYWKLFCNNFAHSCAPGNSTSENGIQWNWSSTTFESCRWSLWDYAPWMYQWVRVMRILECYIFECLSTFRTFGDDAHLYTIYTSNNLVCDFLKDSCASYTLVNEHERRIYVIFRGTKTKKQLILEGWTSLVPKIDFYGVGLVSLPPPPLFRKSFHLFIFDWNVSKNKSVICNLIRCFRQTNTSQMR